MHDTIDLAFVYESSLNFFKNRLQEARNIIVRLETEIKLLIEQRQYLIDNSNTFDYRNVTLYKVEEAAACQAWFEQAGITNYHVFPQSLEKVLQAITDKQCIDDVPIFEKIKEPDFRFYTKDDPFISIQTSKMIASIIHDAKKPAIELTQIGRQARTNKADDFAISMHEIIHRELGGSKVKSFREAARLLEEKEVPTPSLNGKWHGVTLTELNKRWEKLGLLPLTPKSK